MESLEAENKLAASLLLREWRAPVTLGPSECLPRAPRPVPSTPFSSRGRHLIFSSFSCSLAGALKSTRCLNRDPELSTLKTVRFPQISGVPEY